MSPRILLLAALPLTLAACATGGTASRPAPAPPPGSVVQAPVPAPAAPKVSPYAPAQEDMSKRGDYVAGGLYAPGIKDTVPDYVPDVDAIPEPEIRHEPRARWGNRSYSVLGKRYHVMDDAKGYVEEGGASYYGSKFHGRRTSSGEVYDMYAFTAAHRSLPLPSYARVTNLDNGKSVLVRINDRGPFHSGRIIDLSYAAAVKLGYRERGTARVEVRAVLPDGSDGPVLAKAPTPREASAIDRLVGQLPAALSDAGPARPAAPPPAAAAVEETRYRFDMRQDGKVMSADEFDAWMRSRRVRVATGKPGVPDVPPPTPAAAVQAAAPPPPSPVNAAAVAAADVSAASGALPVTLQVASFSNPGNAEHALALLRGANIAGARVHDAEAGGRKVWRLRVGPVAPTQVAELSARVVGLGFGQPQPVRE